MHFVVKQNLRANGAKKKCNNERSHKVSVDQQSKFIYFCYESAEKKERGKYTKKSPTLKLVQPEK